VLALGHDGAGLYNIVDDEPAPMSEWLPALAAALGAKPPRHVPLWLARLIAGKGMVMMADGSRGAANAKAKRELGWTLRYPSWRQGFPAAYGSAAPVSTARGRPLPGRRGRHSPGRRPGTSGSAPRRTQ